VLSVETFRKLKSAEGVASIRCILSLSFEGRDEVALAIYLYLVAARAKSASLRRASSISRSMRLQQHHKSSHQADNASRDHGEENSVHRIRSHKAGALERLSVTDRGQGLCGDGDTIAEKLKSST
jgi:hypothetical protein